LKDNPTKNLKIEDLLEKLPTMGAILDWPENALLALRIIHFSYPPALFVWFTTSQIISICTLENLRAKNNGHGRSLATCLQSSILGSYVSGLDLL
jgi:hypothetical protein